MKKKIFTLLCFIFMTFGLMNGCGGFVDDESLVITSITTELLEDGRTMVVITYEDEDMKPLIFYIPQGEEGIQGEKGDGIESIEYDYDQNGDYIITITFTNPEMEPIILNLKNGVSVSNISSQFDSTTGNTYLIIEYSDGSTSEPIIVPPGKDGKDGNSIIGIKQDEHEDGSITLTFKFSKSDDVIVEIPAPKKGEDGRGIQDIVSVPNGDTYTMIITYTDGETVELEFARPNKWFSESGEPKPEDGIDGDLWYDLAHNIIYVKQNGRWVEVMNFNNVKDETYTVEFNLNDSMEFKASMPAGSLLTYEIECGKYFAASGYQLPSPTRQGYAFNGWYLVKNPTVVNGAFTDLTPVEDDLILYANWIEK